MLPGNALPAYESGTVSDDLGKNIPDNARVDVYESLGGDGYQITFQQNGTEYSYGRGVK